jgi:hypothetical protein
VRAVHQFTLIAMMIVASGAEPYASSSNATETAATGAQSSKLGPERARSIVEAHGFTGVRGLESTSAGSWVGQADQDGRLWHVEIDERGNFRSSSLSRGEAVHVDRSPPRIRLFLVLR